MSDANRVGTIIGGSLSDGFVMKVDRTDLLETLKVGKFVSIYGASYRFFSLVTDIALSPLPPELSASIPQPDEYLFTAIVQKQSTHAMVKLRLMLMLDAQHRVCPVKTIPPHFAPVYEASVTDVVAIFGKEDAQDGRYFAIGTPVDMPVNICLDLDRLAERSTGIFGKTGTGKTFLTRLLLAGLARQRRTVNLIFDMHSEYGVQARQEGSHHAFVKGLKALFPDRVVICSLDPAASRRRGVVVDIPFVCSYQQVAPEDILALQQELNLHPTALESAYLLAGVFKQDWLAVLLARGAQAKELAQEVGCHPESIAALYRKLKRIERLEFFANPGASLASTGVVDQIIEYLQKGITVIVEFGNYSSTFVYLLVANMLTRRIHSEYIAATERFLAGQSRAPEPKKLMIVIEEAHKFLNAAAARQTIFGTIAREMRKYYVSLCVVDQRPSGIDPEILSQIGTKIVAALSDEQDLQAVLTGAPNAAALKGVIAGLDTKKQILLLGHAVPMPIVVQTREYNQDFYDAVTCDELSGHTVQALVSQIY